jgi:hypothetical protein
MKEIEIAKNIALKVNEKVKRVYWTNEKIEKLFGKRSINEILKSKETCFMNPCLDLTLVSSYFLSQEGIPHEFVIEEHLPTENFNFNRLHFVIEFKNTHKNYVLNYKRGNEVYIFEGNYNGREDLPLAQIIRIPGEKINPNKTISENLGYNTLEELTKDKFIGYSLEKNINRLKQDNFKENYEAYKKRFGNELNIITKPQNQL